MAFLRTAVPDGKGGILSQADVGAVGFASFAAGAIQDFSSGVTTDTVLAQEWVIDGFSTLDNTVFSEFFAGGASSRAEIDGRERRADVERVD